MKSVRIEIRNIIENNRTGVLYISTKPSEKLPNGKSLALSFERGFLVGMQMAGVEDETKMLNIVKTDGIKGYNFRHGALFPTTKRVNTDNKRLYHIFEISDFMQTLLPWEPKESELDADTEAVDLDAIDATQSNTAERRTKMYRGIEVKEG